MLLFATSAVARDSGWVIKSFDAQLTVQANADVRVTEDIAVDFGSQQKHGIYRDIPVRNGYDATRDRLIHIDDARVEGDPGTPADLVVMEQGDTVRLRIGSPSQTVSGPHRYRLTYRVAGVMNPFQTHEELYWNVTGSQWSVPIERVSVHIPGPAEVTRMACYRGPTGSTEHCPFAGIQQREGQANTGSLEPGEGMTIVVAFPPGSVQVPPPRLVPVSPPSGHLLDFAGIHRPATADYLFAALLCGLIGFWLVRLYLRKVMDDPATRHVPHGPEGQPPNRLRPAVLNLLLNKRVGERDLTATLVDLAVRGYLSIEELPGSFWSGRPGWRLTRCHRQKGPGEPPLAEYERVLLTSLFLWADSVSLSEVRSRLANDYRRVRELIYDAPEARDWFHGQADYVRTEWGIRSLFLWVVSVALCCGAYRAGRHDVALWLLPFVLGGFALGSFAIRMPRRTPEGSAMLQRAQAFRAFIFTAENRRAELSRQQDLFTGLLPYAIAFGAEDTWGRVFSGLSSQALTRTAHGVWFFGASGSTLLGASALSNAVGSFSSSVGGALSNGSGSGFGGGGFGGGGGGGFSGGGGGGGGGGGW
ncbi:DUF2207 domain-containing protein [Archangium sp.]|uniref:DUF2207 domain-containing protein n=1 Tax=Archangium sp. TaxID=1872627 RepID=UPI0038999019